MGPELNFQLSYSTDCVIIWPSYHAKLEYKMEWTLAMYGESYSQCTKMPVPNNQLKFSQSTQMPQQYETPGWRGRKISLKWFLFENYIECNVSQKDHFDFFHESI